MDYQTLLRLDKNPHFKMTKEQINQLRQYKKDMREKIVRHKTSVTKHKPKVVKHNTRVKEELDERD